MYGNTAFDHGHCSISSACIVKDGLHMEQGNYGENFDRGYEEQARPRQQVIVIGEPVPDKRTTKNLAICSLVLGILAIVFSFLPYIGIILALIALPQGIVSLVQKRPGKSRSDPFFSIPLHLLPDIITFSTCASRSFSIIFACT